jgi:ribosomal protein S18 acetylase RimI-like enzyme
LVEADTPAKYEVACALIEEYAAQIRSTMGIDLCFQNLNSELAHLPDMYGPPTGCLLLAGSDSEWVGCCALRRLSDGVCEMKRLYIKPAARGAHLGRRFTEHLLSKARALGYRRMVLDTLKEMTAARTLYASLGFRQIEPYYLNPTAGVTYMELDLGTAQQNAPSL